MYCTKHLLGKGGYGSVYETTYKNEKVAIKRIKSGHSSLPKAVVREILALNAMSKHGTSVKIKDIWVDHLNIHIAMGLGTTTLHSFIHNASYKKRLELFPAVFTSCVSILRSLRNSRIAHYDIKPGNILINEKTGECKLIDFGISDFVVTYNQKPNRIVYTSSFRPPEYEDYKDNK